jgi:hypothetical protein
MRTATLTSLWLIVLVLAAATASAVQAAPPYTPRIDKDGWEVLFDGKHLDAWEEAGQGDAWKVNEQGDLYVARSGPHLISKRRYCDFVLELDFKVAPKCHANSGVFIYAHDAHREVATGLEIQILDNDSYGIPYNALNANGALYSMTAPAVDANKLAGEWNHFRITANGDIITVELNGKQIVHSDLSKWTRPGLNPDGTHVKFAHAAARMPREGFIELQNYGGVRVWFRNIRLKPLSDRQPKYTGKEPFESVLAK